MAEPRVELHDQLAPESCGHTEPVQDRCQMVANRARLALADHPAAGVQPLHGFIQRDR